MSRHYCTKHPFRTNSRYPERLRKRGLNKTPQLAPVEVLRTRQARRIRDSCLIDHNHNTAHCEGHPWLLVSAATDDD